MQERNYAYIYGQNLFLGIKSDNENWMIDYKKFTSSLYKSINIKYKSYIIDAKKKIEYKKKMSFLKH